MKKIIILFIMAFSFNLNVNAALTAADLKDITLEKAQELQKQYCETNYVQQNGGEDCKKIIDAIIILNGGTPSGSNEETENNSNDNDSNNTNNDTNLSDWTLNGNNKLDFNTSNGCESYLGKPDDNINKPPAYYLQFVFNLIKYAAILLLFALTVMEFSKAVVSSNQDAMKKALQNTIKRLIIAVVIFFLPILIKFVFELLGIYSAGTCGIS